MPLGNERLGQKQSSLASIPTAFQNGISLNPELRHAPSVAVFKKKILSIIRPLSTSVFGIHDSKGLFYLTQLRVGLGKLNFPQIQA